MFASFRMHFNIVKSVQWFSHESPSASVPVEKQGTVKKKKKKKKEKKRRKKRKKKKKEKKKKREKKGERERNK